jgi:5-oxoprolinase (ATP-hydrolysing)
LYEKVVEVDERVTIESRDDIEVSATHSPEGDLYVRGLSGDKIRIIQSLGECLRINCRVKLSVSQDVPSITSQLRSLYADGFRAVAVCLMHSFTYQHHELEVEKIAKEVGFTQVSVSSQLQPMSESIFAD